MTFQEGEQKEDDLRKFSQELARINGEIFFPLKELVVVGKWPTFDFVQSENSAETKQSERTVGKVFKLITIKW